jgi:hypothetical protein
MRYGPPTACNTSYICRPRLAGASAPVKRRLASAPATAAGQRPIARRRTRSDGTQFPATAGPMTVGLVQEVDERSTTMAESQKLLSDEHPAFVRESVRWVAELMEAEVDEPVAKIDLAPDDASARARRPCRAPGRCPGSWTAAASCRCFGGDAPVGGGAPARGRAPPRILEPRARRVRLRGRPAPAGRLPAAPGSSVRRRKPGPPSRRPAASRAVRHLWRMVSFLTSDVAPGTRERVASAHGPARPATGPGWNQLRCCLLRAGQDGGRADAPAGGSIRFSAP